jgi:hypothetical protein
MACVSDRAVFDANICVRRETEGLGKLCQCREVEREVPEVPYAKRKCI